VKVVRNCTFVIMAIMIAAASRVDAAAAFSCDSAVVGSGQNWPNTFAGTAAAFVWGAGVDCNSGCGAGCTYTGEKEIWVHTITWQGQQVVDAQVSCSCVPQM
jgi:hypothetical protein